MLELKDERKEDLIWIREMLTTSCTDLSMVYDKVDIVSTVNDTMAGGVYFRFFKDSNKKLYTHSI